jgi:radical SAM protein with 4Fe4S-binding SPASM domain
MGILSACRTFGSLHTAKRLFDREKREHRLTYLFWECTLGCNLSCRHCGSRCSPKRARQGDLSGEEAKRIFREIAEDFEAPEITVAVTGGEPLTRPDLFEVMSAARDLGFFWGMVTNGVLITGKTVDDMERAGMGTVSISIDGDESAHAVLRGSAENYRRAMGGLKLLLDRGGFLECVQVTTVVGRHNIDQLGEMYARFADMGVGEWRLLMVDPIGRMLDAENRELLLNGEELVRLLDFVAARRIDGRMPVTFEESGFLGLEYEGRVRDYYFHCPAGINIGSILHDGAIGACPSLERCMVEGDARTERFSTVWNGRFRRYRDRESTRRKGSCAACKWWKHCEGGSLHLWDWDRGEPRVCHLKMLKEAGRGAARGTEES